MKVRVGVCEGRERTVKSESGLRGEKGVHMNWLLKSESITCIGTVTFELTADSLWGRAASVAPQRWA